MTSALKRVGLGDVDANPAGSKATFSVKVRSLAAAGAALLASLFILIGGVGRHAESPYFVLPATYALLCIVFPAMLNRSVHSVGMAILNIVVFSKFVIGPLLWASLPADGLITTYYATSASRVDGFWILWAELFTAFVVVQCFAPRVYARPTRARESATGRSNLVLIVVALAGTGAFLEYPSLLGRYNFFVLSSLMDRDLGELPLGGIMLLLTDMVLFLVPVLLIYRFKARYDQSGSLHWVAFSFIAALPAMMIFRGTSRLSVLVPTLVWLVVLVYLYPKYRRQLMAMALAIMIGVFVVISLFKQFGYSLTDETSVRPALSVQEVSRNMNIYFSGPENQAAGLDMIGSNRERFSTATLFDDLSRNTIGLAKLSDSNATTTTQFNELIYGVSGKTDQIVPLSVQSRAYFGPLGTTLLLAVALYLMMRCDRRAQAESRMEYKYVFVYVTVTLCLALMTSVGSLSSTLTNFLLPILIVLKLNDLATTRKADRPRALAGRNSSYAGS